MLELRQIITHNLVQVSDELWQYNAKCRTVNMSFYLPYTLADVLLFSGQKKTIPRIIVVKLMHVSTLVLNNQSTAFVQCYFRMDYSYIC